MQRQRQKGQDSPGCFGVSGWLEHKVKCAFDKGKKVLLVVPVFKSSTIGRNDLAKVQEELHDHPLGLLKQECKTRSSSTHILVSVII